MELIQLLVILLVVGILLGAINSSYLTMDARIKQIITTVIIIVVVLWLLFILLAAVGLLHVHVPMPS